MKCAISFLSVVFLVVTLGAIAIYILWMTEECTENFFRCPEDQTCIPFKKLCDSKKDCSNGSDELPYRCADLTNIDIVFHFPWTPPSNGPSTPTPVPCKLVVPPDCTVDERKCIIHCKDVGWDSFPTQIAATRLFLVNVTRKGRSFSWGNATSMLSSMKVLALQNHSRDVLRDFPWEIFKDNPYPRILYIEWNNIAKFPDGVFVNMENLRWLFLQDNKLETIGSGSLANLRDLTKLDLSYNRLTFDNFVFQGMPKLVDLSLKYNKISRINNKIFHELVALNALDLTGNQIHHIDAAAFSTNIGLTELILSENKLSSLDPSLFANMSNLKKLSLSVNPMDSFPLDIFCNLQSLESLNLTGMEILNIDPAMFSCLKNLTYIHFKKFTYCRYVKHVPICYPNSNGLSSVQDLLSAKSLRLIIWVVALLTVCGNITVLIGRWRTSRPSRILDILVSNLAGADILTGFYLIVIAMKDIELRNNYMKHAYDWSTSWLCQSVGVVAMVSCETSLLILTVMSLERYLVISGVTETKLSKKLAFVSMFMIWTFVIALAITPVFHWRGKTTFYGSSGLCFPLHMDDPFSVGWEYTAFVFIGLNSICLLLITFSYGKLYWVIRQSRLSMPVMTIRDMEMALTFRFFFMVLSDFLCWLPIILLKISVIAGYEIHEDVHAWLMIFVLPLNSTINPFLYTFSTGSIRAPWVHRLVASCTAGVTPARRQSLENQVAHPNGMASKSGLCLPLFKQKVGKEDCHPPLGLTHMDSLTSK